MKTKCICGSMVRRCWVENGLGVIACRDCGLILEGDAICGCEDMSGMDSGTRHQKHDRAVRSGYITARQKAMNLV